MTATYRLQLPLLIITYVLFSSLTKLVHAIQYSKQSVLISLVHITKIYIVFLFSLVDSISWFKNQSENSCWTNRYKCTSGWNNSISLHCFQTIRRNCHLVLEWFLYIGQNSIITTWNNIRWSYQYLSIYCLSKIPTAHQWTIEYVFLFSPFLSKSPSGNSIWLIIFFFV